LTQTIYRMMIFPKQIAQHELRSLRIETSMTNEKILVVTDHRTQGKFTLCFQNSAKKMLVAAMMKVFKNRPISQMKLDAHSSHLFARPNEFTTKQIHRIHRVFIRSGAQKQLASDWHKYIKNESVMLLDKLQQCIENEQKDTTQVAGLKDFVMDVVNFNQRIRAFEMNFVEDVDIFSATNKALGEIMTTEMKIKNSSTGIPMLNYVVDYCDRLVRGRNEKAPMSDVEFDNELANIVALYKIAVDKDLLQEHSRRHLYRRLLSYGDNEIPLLDERTLLVKLKMTLGVFFTSKMENMVKDMSTSRDLVQVFENRPKKKVIPITFKLLVLTQGYWPPMAEPIRTKSGTRLNVPHEMAMCMLEFDQFYRDRTGNGRRLHWVMNLGSVVLVARYISGEYEMTLDANLASVLCVFDNNTSANARQIADALNIEEEKDARQLLERVSSTKLKLLNNNDDTYSINNDFVSRAKKLKLVKIASSGTNLSEKENKDVVNVVVDKDRAFIIEACCVRIMKARKQLTHQALMAQVSEHLMSKFIPDVKMIKQRIDALIEREYIERDPNDANVYVYLA
jgi:hypothetical protein